MAEIISIDMVLSALMATYELCKDVRNMPKLIETAKKETNKTRIQVALLQKKMNDPKSSLNKAPKEVKKMLQEYFKEIIQHANEVGELVRERKQIPRWELGSILVWVATRKPKFEEITEGYNQCRTQIQFVMATFVHTNADDAQMQMLKENQEMLQKLYKALEATRKTHDKAVVESKKYQSWTEQNSRRVTDAAIHPDDKTKAQLVDELVKLGLTKQDASAKVAGLLQTIRKERGRSKSWQYRAQADKQQQAGGKMGGGGNGIGGKTVVVGVNKKNDQDCSPNSDPPKSVVSGGEKKPNDKKEHGGKGQSTPQNDGPAKTNATKAESKPKAPKSNVPRNQETKDPRPKKSEQKQVHFEVKKHPKTEGSWIMFVDSTNGARSIMAQTYMELVRSWTMNTQKRWLFGRVNSCGVLIPTYFNKSPVAPSTAGRLPADEAIKAIAGDHQYFWSKDPDEKDTILTRMRSHRSRGIYDTDFYKYQHIICFGELTRKQLEALKEAAEARKPGKVVSTIHVLKGCSAYNPLWGNNPDQLMKLRGKLKTSIKNFLVEEFEWVRPLEGIAHGKWRTLQLLVSQEEAHNVGGDKGMLKEVDKIGCKVNMTIEYGDQTCLVSISGPRGKLGAARKVLFGN